MKAEVYPGADGWRWNVRGINHEILASGEAYVRREDCEHVLALLFGRGIPIQVTVRNHASEVSDSYMLRTVIEDQGIVEGEQGESSE